MEGVTPAALSLGLIDGWEPLASAFSPLWDARGGARLPFLVFRAMALLLPPHRTLE
jgi:hypothetical protein